MQLIFGVLITTHQLMMVVKLEVQLVLVLIGLTVVGPLNFSLSQVITKSDNDVEETFRFNLGTTF
jgi:outer membrane protein insertion porin family